MPKNKKIEKIENKPNSYNFLLESGYIVERNRKFVIKACNNSFEVKNEVCEYPSCSTDNNNTYEPFAY